MLSAPVRLPKVNSRLATICSSSGLRNHAMLNASVSFRSVLLVDSDPAVHETLAGVLARDDRRIDDLYDGAEALSRLREAPYDVLLAGPGRNGLDGLKLLRRARSIRPDLPVIVTGDPDPARVVGAIRHRAFSYF